MGGRTQTSNFDITALFLLLFFFFLFFFKQRTGGLRRGRGETRGCREHGKFSRGFLQVPLVRL